MKKKLTTREMTIVGLCAALMGIFSQLAIPLPTIPLTLQVLGVIFIAVILEAKLATLTMLVYMLIGTIGMPVFANFNRGISAIVGPTGGYITGFVVMAFIIGKAAQQKNKGILIIATYLGLFMQYTIGTLQLKGVSGMSFQDAMIAGVYPFIIKDIIMTGIALSLALQVKKRLKGIGHLSHEG